MKFMTPVETARTLGHSRPYIYQLIAVGKLPAKREDGRWMIPVSEVEKRRRYRDEGKRYVPRPIQSNSIEFSEVQ